MEKEKETLDENITEDVEETKAEETTSKDSEESSKENNIDTEETCQDKDEKSGKKDNSDRKKIKNPLKKKDKRDQKIEELEDKYQRLFAEFQNYRTRSEKEKALMFEVGAKAIIEKILPVVDNLERGITILSEEDKETPVGQGMVMICKQMTTTLEEMGVTVIETEGQEFDPELHNAVMHEDNEEMGDNMISLELQKGYKYRDTVIRHSMVKVAN